MLVNSIIANEFLTSYKAVLAEVNNGKMPQKTDEFGKCRELLYANLELMSAYKSITENFKNALSKSVYGRFIFLKKYKKWYAFQYVKTGQYFAVLGLTTPIETMVKDFCVIETALVPFRGLIVCDGLIVNKNILLGKNMMKNCRDGYLQAKQTGDLVRNL